MHPEPRPVAADRNAAADAPRTRPAMASGPAVPDFALAMRRVEAECYDTL
jgi:hypothetical protein